MIKTHKRTIFIVSFLLVNILFIYKSVLAQGTWGEKMRTGWKQYFERKRRVEESQKADSLFGLGGRDYRIPVTWITELGDHGPGDYGRKIKFQGLTRFYEIHVPVGYEKTKPTPVVLVFHGGGGYPGAARYQSGMDAIADRKGFIVVYPGGTSKFGFTDRLLIWNDGRPFTDNGTFSKVDDVGFVTALLDDLSKFLNIDTKRIYACGFSNGAQFSNRLAQQLSDRLAAIATVAGHRAADDFFPPPPRPISKMQFSGLKDSLAPYYGGSPPKRQKGLKIAFETHLRSVKETIQSWVAHNGCPSTPCEVKRIGKAVMTRYGPGRDGTEVILWTLEGGGHTWPGGKMTQVEVEIELGHINKDISASELMWEFFQRHPLK